MPGRRQANAKRTNRKIPPQVNHARQLSGGVQTIWTILEHGISAYFHTNAALVARHTSIAVAISRRIIMIRFELCALCLQRLIINILISSLLAMKNIRLLHCYLDRAGHTTLWLIYLAKVFTCSVLKKRSKQYWQKHRLTLFVRK